jgi:signal transduction histidine kinase
MQMNNKTYFSKGLAFLREHPQLWVTALVGVVIVGSFIFTAWRFATLAEDAQEELINVRIGSILDAFVLFAPDVLNSPDVLRARITTLKQENPTIDSFAVYAEHGNTSWRVYVSVNGPREGAIINDAVPKVFSLAMADPKNAYTLETQNEQGRYFITARAIVDTTGKPIAIAVTNQGLAAVDKNLSDRIHTSMYILFGMVLVITILFLRHARIVDFAILYKKQLEIDEMKDSFISMASHELKSPLSVIRGYIEFLKEGVTEEEKKQEYLRRIDVSAEELRGLVDDILDVSRIEMGRLKFEFEEVSVSDVLLEVVDMFKAQATDKGLELNILLSEEEKKSLVSVDRGRLKQVVINLVSNAIKYTLTGLVSVTQETQNGVVSFSVRDSGIGMTAEEQKKLFGKFYRVEAEESKGVSGTGLGLWITKFIIENMKGSISVESIKGEGSKFVVQFPISKHNQVSTQ